MQLVHPAGPVLYPPAYPLWGATVDRLLGTGVLAPMAAASAAAGVLAAPATAWAVARLGGRAAGRWAGVLALCLPATTVASLTVEPVTILWLLLALMLAAAAALARGGGAGPALALGLLGGLATVTKEGGGLDLLLLALPALVLAPAGRTRAAVALALAALPLLLAAQALAPSAGQAKATVPLQDVVGWLGQGRVPPPLLHPGDPVGALDREAVAAFAGASPAGRAATALAIQGERLAFFLGPWLLAWPLVLWVVRREERVVRGLVLPHLLLLPAGLLVVVQGRHAEWLAWGTLVGLALALARAPRWLGGLGLALALAHGAAGLARELPRVRGQALRARVVDAVTRDALARLPAGCGLESPLHRVGARTGMPVRAGMDGEEVRPPPCLALAVEGDGSDETIDVLPDHAAHALRWRYTTPVGRFGLYERGAPPAAVEGLLVDERGQIRPEDDPADPDRPPRPGRSRR
ncbi:hypothetical protein L6R53_00105 [Myxococcota bacterium]|nr:hypothetical protein [Myxococcota bacterium]